MTDPNDWLGTDTKHAAEIRYLVEHTDLSPLQAKELVAKHGTNRPRLLELAKTIKAES